MIIVRTPYRVSFFGGLSDYPQWFKSRPGAVLSATINRYCYISVRRLPPFHPHKTRAVWSKIETVSSNSEIEHPAIRACLEYLDITDGLEIHHDGDLPGRSGMGSSASFTVGLLHALHALKSEMVSKRTLALEAMEVDQDLVQETVGCQDHVAAAFGGFNHMGFAGDRACFQVQPITLDSARLKLLKRHLMLFYTGISRHASEVAAKQVAKFDENPARVERMAELADEGLAILSDGALRDFGELLHNAWQIKRHFGASSDEIDAIYETALKAGAIGGKILGAGKGGMLLVFVEPQLREDVNQAMSGLLEVPFEFERQGSQVVYYSED